jgi:hypothetical protein
MYSSGCLICGAELIYSQDESALICAVCKTERRSNAACQNGHFVCDHCHEANAFDFISAYCLTTTAADPIDIAVSIMRHPSVAMHGPEHHFLVPAALAAACDLARHEEHLLPERRYFPV